MILKTLAFLLLAASGVTTEAPAPPVAAVKPYDVVSPHGTRNDPYYWLRDDTRSKPEVLDYLKAENAYYEAMSAPYRELTETLSKEIVGRLKEDDSTVPYKDKDYLYFARFEAGKQHPIHVRRSLDSDKEQVLIDGNREAEGKEYYSLGARAVSPRQDLLAFTEDTRGRFQFTLRFREIATGRDLPERITGLSRPVVWAGDNRTVYYVENDPVTLLSTRVRKHVLGTDPKSDPVVYEEKDTSFYLNVGKTGDERFILIRLGSTVASELRFIEAGDPSAAMRVLAPRENGVLYEADHVGGRWVIKTDWKAPNFRLMKVADGNVGGGKAEWQELMPHDPKVFLEDFAVFEDYLAIGERSDGLLRVRYAPWADLGRWTYVPSEAASTQYFQVNAEQDTPLLRYAYTSLATPHSVYELDMRTGVRKLLKREPVPGYDPAGYATERVWATARDGARVPVSLVYRKGFARNGTAPLYQQGYGSYGAAIDPAFNMTVVSLLDRGFVYALAHIRGGQELGRAWYDDGRLLKKKNTFTDFIDVTDFLVREKYAAPDKVFASGGSAGGLLVGAVANMAGEKYRGIAAHVPYVDVVTTMLDETIPLVTNEFDEWGNPKQKEYYDYMLSYSPYDNVRAQRYPAMLVTTGLHDSQVQYYEPAKWVARLRAMKTDKNPLLFKINMGAGHGGRSGRFENLREIAEEYAFFLHQLGNEGKQTLRIDNARLVDGTGAPARTGSLRIAGDRIAAVGDVEPLPGEPVFDAKGLVLAPGFIDTHSHADSDLLEMPDALGAVSQGITTVVGGQDGGSAFPLSDLFARLERAPPAVNVASYSGHGTLREKVLGGDFRRAATASELAEMSRLLESDLEAGALGLSTGLEYDPGIFSTRDELLALARVAARHHGRYISHIRSEDRRFWEAIDEILAIGREAKLPVQISHIKLAMRSLWNEAPRLLALLDDARSQGIDVTADIYPYLYWHSTLTVLFPERDFENLETARQVLAEIAPADGLLLGRYLPNPAYAGRTVAEIAKERGEAPEKTLIALIRDAEALRRQGKEGVESVIGTSMIEGDLEKLLTWPHTNFCTDG
ncbi:MAG TPA: prolyl oligopeptidase family serine peptidase, partial [Thermoanaerobaculia bacterium]|nr:prolyl oligopeptidase family serine peptidase [Thermoanaerobaculia bacterium]